MQSLAEWLAATPANARFGELLWVVPVAQCIHILAITTVFGAVMMICLRIAGLAGRSQTMTETACRFMPWLWSGFAVALLTGIVMIVAEPVRELINISFWAKMAILLVSLILAAGFQLTAAKRSALWGREPADRPITRLIALGAVLLWIAVIILGRLIAYTQSPV